MKKLFYPVLAVMALLMAASCSQDEELVAGGSESQTVTFEVALPGATQTRAIADGVEVGKGNIADNLIYALYEKLPDGSLKQGSSITSGALTQGVATDNRADGHFEVKLDMVKGLTYEILFLAYNPANCIFNISDPLTQDLRQLTLKSTLNANQESYDAFVASVQHSVNNEAVTYIELTRPFAQVNAATTVEDLDKTKKLEAVVTNSQLTINQVPTKYNVFTAEATEPANLTYKSAAILKNINAAQGAHTNEIIEVEGKNYYYLTLAYVLAGKSADADKSLHNAKFEFFRDADPKLVQTIDIANLPIQRNYRTNVIGNLLTQSEGFEVVIDAEFNKSEEHNQIFVSTAEQLKEVLNTATENTKIYLTADITLKGGTNAYTATADSIIIDGSKNITRSASGKKFTITFEDDYRTYVGFGDSDTRLVFNNVNICRKTTNTDTHWHNNNMKFTCNAEFNNVDFNKGICFDNAKTFVMNNCSINKGKVATYALFITAGCNVTIDGLSVTHSEGVAGRGIKIVDEDVTEPTLTTLSVSNATFVTESKAAILVGSEAGAKITLSNLDITKVKADNFNAVWVDEEYKDYADKVTVEGGFVVVEGAAEENNPFLIEGNTVKVTKGEYGALPKVANGVTIEAEEGTVFTGTSSVSGKNVTIKNVIFKGEDKALTSYLRGTTFENCQFDATYGAQWCYAEDDVVFRGCTFGSETSKRGIHFDGGEGNVSFETCVFYSFNALGSSVKKYTFNDCDIKVSSKALNGFNGVNMYNTTYEYTNCRFEPGTFTDCASNNVVASYTDCSYTGDKSIYSLVRFDKDPATCTITFDGKQMLSNSTHLASAVAAMTGSEATFILAKGSFAMPTSFGSKTLYFEGADKEATILEMLKTGSNNPQYAGNSLNCKNLTVKRPIGPYQGFNGGEENYDNCIIVGRLVTYAPLVTANGCTFNPGESDDYNVQIYSAGTSKFTNCTFNAYKGRSVYAYSEGEVTMDITFDGCKFFSVNGKNESNFAPAIRLHTELGIKGNLTINNCTNDDNFNLAHNGGLWVEWNNSTKAYTYNFVKKINGVTADIFSASGLLSFANDVNVRNNSFAGKTVKLGADINLAGIDWEPIGQTGATTFNGIFDGNGYTISNLSVDSEDQTGANYSSGLFGWVESHSANNGHIKNVTISGATIKGRHNCGALVGYITEGLALVENCHVTGATVSCTMANSEANGDKAGALIGNATVATTVKDCTAANSTVSAGRDAGQVIGAGRETNVTGCSATNVTVTANGTSTGANIRNEVIGRLL